MLNVRSLFVCGLVVAVAAGFVSDTLAADKDKPTKALKALLITGGCCHDYEAQKKIISEGVSARANVEWTIVHEGGSSSKHRVSIHEKPGWAKGYDVVVHNECFAAVNDEAFVENILKEHEDGTPAVVLHCAMHSYRVNPKQYMRWFQLCGVRSHNHGPHTPIKVSVQKPDHPIMKGITPEWTTPKGELYNIAEIFDGTQVLATGVRVGKGSDEPNACIWTSKFGKAKVFGTTIGHHNETMLAEPYLDVLTRGILWSADKLNDDGTPVAGYGPIKRNAETAQAE